MATVIKNPSLEVYEKWSKAIEKLVGKGNHSMDNSTLIARAPYAQLKYMGGPINSGTLEGDEGSTLISFQAESFADGQKALKRVYQIDEVSHQAMVGMGFRRTYGPELVENADKNIRRCVSRYSMIYTGKTL